jgi:hypothetical protein
MECAVEIGPGAGIYSYIRGFIKFGSGIRKLTNTRRQEHYLISLRSLLQSMERGLIMENAINILLNSRTIKFVSWMSVLGTYRRNTDGMKSAEIRSLRTDECFIIMAD